MPLDDKSTRSPTKKSSTPREKSQNDIPNPGTILRWEQVDLDQVTSIEWVHARDLDYYHDPYCNFRASYVERGREKYVSHCRKCGRTVESELSGYKVYGTDT